MHERRIMPSRDLEIRLAQAASRIRAKYAAQMATSSPDEAAKLKKAMARDLRWERLRLLVKTGAHRSGPVLWSKGE